MAVDRGCYIDQSQSLNIHMDQPNFGKLTSLHFYAWSKVWTFLLYIIAGSLGLNISLVFGGIPSIIYAFTLLKLIMGQFALKQFYFNMIKCLCMHNGVSNTSWNIYLCIDTHHWIAMKANFILVVFSKCSPQYPVFLGQYPNCLPNLSKLIFSSFIIGPENRNVLSKVSCCSRCYQVHCWYLCHQSNVLWLLLATCSSQFNICTLLILSFCFCAI